VEENGKVPVREQLRRRKWTWLGQTLRRIDGSTVYHKARTTVDTARPQRKRVAQEHLERDLEKEMWMAGFRCIYGGGSSRQSWMELSGQ